MFKMSKNRVGFSTPVHRVVNHPEEETTLILRGIPANLDTRELQAHLRREIGRSEDQEGFQIVTRIVSRDPTWRLDVIPGRRDRWSDYRATLIFDDGVLRTFLVNLLKDGVENVVNYRQKVDPQDENSRVGVYKLETRADKKPIPTVEEPHDDLGEDSFTSS